MPNVSKYAVRNRYTDLEQQQVAAIVVEAGGIMTKEVEAKIQLIFPGAAHASIWRWYKKWGDKVRPQSMEIIRSSPVALTAHNLVNNLLGDAYLKGLEALNEEAAWEKAGIKDRAIAWGLLEERRRLSIGLSQHVIDTVKLIISTCNRKGYDPEDYLSDMLAGLNESDND